MPSGSSISRREATIPVGSVSLPGTLVLPPGPRGVVAFAHGSGSSRHSSRNQYVASVLQQAGIGTLLFDLLTEPEAADRRNVFDLQLLSERLLAAAHWVMSLPELAEQPVGLFGASTGAGAALIAAAEEEQIGAVVSRGGRPDLAGPWLERVRAPVLLIVGGDDGAVLGLNREALGELRCEKELAIVEGATHLFEEPGTLEQAARLAADWFVRHLARRSDT
jgi:putative phosphoribosyl transferase